MKQIIITVMMITSTFAGMGQHFNTDSLINVLNRKELDEKEKLKTLNNVAEGFLYTDIDKMMEWAEKGLEYARKVKNYTYMAKFYDYKGKGNAIKGDFEKALPYHEKAIEAARKGKDIGQESTALNSIAVGYANKSDYAKALEYYLKALSLMDKDKKYETKKITTLMNIGSIHNDLKNYDQAYFYYNKGREIAENITDTLLIKNKMDLFYKCHVYINLFTFYMNQRITDSVSVYVNMADSICNITNNKQNKMAVYECLALLNGLYYKNHEKAEYYAKEHLKLAEEFGGKRSLIAAYIKLSDIYSYQEKYKEMDEYAMKAYELDSTNLEYNAFETYSITFANIYLDDKDKAATYLMKFSDIARERSGKGLHDALAEMEVKYETEKKELRIAALERERLLYAGVGILGFLLALSVWLFFMYRRKLVVTQAALDGEAVERKRMASDLHDGLGGMLTIVKRSLERVEHLQTAREMLDKSIEEMRRIAHYLMPASLAQYGLKTAIEDFCFHIPTVNFRFEGDDNRYDEKIEMLVYRGIHELINNSLKHSGAERINVTLTEEG
ncbi:MAG: tetratricopeptide repeat protein, partial [Tannerella sp.]|nr:tetratricopeptide repeat protein [Tannerella sp.]